MDDIEERFPHLYRKLPELLGVSRTALNGIRKRALVKGEHWLIHAKTARVSALGLTLLREAIVGRKATEPASSAHPEGETALTQKTAADPVERARVLGRFHNKFILRALVGDQVVSLHLRANQLHLQLLGKTVNVRQRQGAPGYELFGRVSI